MTTQTNNQSTQCGTPYGTTDTTCTRAVSHDDDAHIDASEHAAPTGDGDGVWVWACTHRFGHIGATRTTCGECGQVVDL